MSEQSSATPNIPVNQAFDPVERQAQKDFDAYLESRPYQDEKGNVHNPEDNAFINIDQYFDDQRDTAEAQSQAKYEDMSMSELAKKMATAEHFEDKTMENDVHDVLHDKIMKQHKKTKSGVRDIEHNAQRMDNLVDRVMSVKDLELERLKAEEPVSGRSEDDKTKDTDTTGTDEKSTEESNGPQTAEQPDETDHVPPTLDETPVAAEEDDDAIHEQKTTELPAEEDETALLFEPGGIGRRVRGAMANATRKLRELPTRGFVAGQSKLANAQEYYNDEELGTRRRKITALVVGAVGLAGLSYLAHKGAGVPSGNGTSQYAGETANQHAPQGLELTPVFPGVKAHQHAQEAIGNGGLTFPPETHTAAGTGGISAPGPELHAHETAPGLKPGQNPWTVSEQELHSRGIANPTDAQIQEFDQNVLHVNDDMTEEEARHLPVGTVLRLPK